MTERQHAIEVRNISKNFGGVQALKNVTLNVYAGETFAIVGENGAGKSTLMKILAGVYPAGSYDGTLIVNDHEAKFAGVRAAEQAGIVMIPQELNVPENLTVAENLFLGRLPGTLGVVDWNRVFRDAKSLVAKYGINVPVESQMQTLSLSQRQLVELAKAMSQDVKILIMDEPTTSLTPAEIDRLFRQLAVLKEHGVTVLYISHRLEEVCRISDRVAVLRDGSLVDVRDNANLTQDEIVSLMIGRDLSQMYPKQEVPIGEVLLEVNGLSIDHPALPGRKLVEDVSFAVRAGEIIGLFGLVGAGRSDVVEAIFGAHSSQVAGEVKVKGEVKHIRQPVDAIRSGIGLVTEDRKHTGIVQGMSVAHNMTLTIPDKIAEKAVVSSEKEVTIANSLVKALSIKTASLEHPIDSLSGGNQQKVVIAKWLATEPRVLILDEPTRGVDVGAKVEIYQILSNLAAKGVGILVVSSEVPEILGICDRILIMWRGRVVKELTRAEAAERVLMNWAVGGA